MSIHDYDTALVRADTLNSTHVLVGESGGLSAVYNVEKSYAMGGLAVETEHGTLYMEPEDEVSILAVVGPLLEQGLWVIAGPIEDNNEMLFWNKDERRWVPIERASVYTEDEMLSADEPDDSSGWRSR